MDRALYCHSGGTDIIVARDLAGSEEKRNRMKSYLRCPTCLAPAYFRIGSRDGKDPCFFAKHKPDCTMASSSQRERLIAAVVIREVERITKNSSTLELNLNLSDRDPWPASTSVRTVNEIDDGETRVRRQYTKESTNPDRPSRVGGIQLLRYLVDSESFRRADIKIKLPGMDKEFTTSRLFRRFSEITTPVKSEKGRWYGFWGQLAGSDDNMKCLSTNGQGTAYIIIDERIREQIYRRWNITRQNITGAYCLVFGKPELSGRNNVCVKVFREDRIVFWIRKEADVEGKLNEVYASAGAPSSLDPGLQTLQAYSLDALRKDDWT